MDFGTNKKGALPSQMIQGLISGGFIKNAKPENIKPSSLDLTLSDEAYKVDGIFSPFKNETVRNVLEKMKKEKHSLEEPLVRNQMYIVRINETLALPKSVYGFCNPKSTSGRIDMHVRLLADGITRFDSISAGWTGELWVAIMPKTFSVKMAAGQSYNQLRFFNSDTRLSETELQISMHQYSLLWNIHEQRPHTNADFIISDNDGSFIQTLDISGDGIVGYRGIKSDKVLDLSLIKHYDSSEFFEPIKKDGDFLRLSKDEFYILSTYEAVRVPPELACEMVSMDDRSGEFRSHYAGFIDPGWGWGRNGEGKGRPLTLEVRPFEDIVVRNKQPIAKIRFEKMTDVPDMVYDGISSNYVTQSGPRLGKYFKV